MSPLAQRVRRIAVVVAVLAIAAAAFGMWPDAIEVHYHHADEIELMRAGGWSLVVWAVVQSLVAKLVYSDPTRRAAAAWIAGSVAIDIAGLTGWLVENFRIGARVSYWPAQLTGACASATAILVFAVLPILLVASDRTEPPDAPRARVVD
jgi:hypothetical protein